jgi:MOSC domain-containing protein YiiM
MNEPHVAAVCCSATHSFSKPVVEQIHLLAGQGVAGDAHCGATVKHRSRVAADPTQPNLRQIHLLHAELHEELQARGFAVGAGTMGENITTRGLDLLALPVNTRLYIGATAVVEITGLRNPCQQLDHYQTGLTNAVLERTAEGQLIRKAGIMGIILIGGDVFAGDLIRVELPALPHRPLERV